MMSSGRRYVLLALLMLVLFALSELVYSYNNSTPLLTSTYLRFSSFCLGNKNYSCGSFFLQKASDTRFRYYKNLYPDQIKENLDFTFDKGALEKYGPEKSDFTERRLTFIYYQLGLNAFNKGDMSSAISAWQKATYLDPDLSYTYLELANLYQKTGDGEMARQTLERCIKFNYPRNHCSDFLNTNIAKSVYEELGFLEKEIIKIFPN